jgi:hypothetical protein
MKITTKNKLDIEILDVPYNLTFAWDKKRGVASDKDHWFTPSGICKVYIGALYNNHLGDISEAEYKTLKKLMTKEKSDVLTDGRRYYTTGDNNIMTLDNFSTILYQINNEWEGRKYIEGWVQDDRVYYRNEWNELVCD